LRTISDNLNLVVPIMARELKQVDFQMFTLFRQTLPSFMLSSLARPACLGGTVWHSATAIQPEALPVERQYIDDSNKTEGERAWET